MTDYTLDERLLCDVRMILDGSFSPLNGFMIEEQYRSVIDSLHLPTGELWPIPIVFPMTTKTFISIDETILLRDVHDTPIASLLVKDIYTPNIDYECRQVLGTTDDRHPYVEYMKSWGDIVYIGGPLTAIKQENFTPYRFSPLQIKQYIQEHEWKTIVGFQTRNPMHRCHFELTQYALRQAGDDAKLLLQPIVGCTQATDIDATTRMRCYKAILPRYQPGTVKMSVLPLSMRMAGPREAVLHALIRKNYGCTHFIVGRDHAGPSTTTKEGQPFYEPYGAHALLETYKDELGITIIPAKMFCYVSNKGVYLPMNEICVDDTVETVSGTQLRHLLDSKLPIPDWFTFPEVRDELVRIRKGICIYIVGLPSAGKTTVANALDQQLKERLQVPITVLDGDVVRTHLSRELGFSKQDRSTNVRRIGYVAKEIVKHGGIVICANIAPYSDDREYNRRMISSVGKYIEVFMNTSLEECERRDVKGLYALARQGVIKNFTGISDPFEAPTDPSITFTENNSVNECVDTLVRMI